MHDGHNIRNNVAHRAEERPKKRTNLKMPLLISGIYCLCGHINIFMERFYSIVCFEIIHSIIIIRRSEREEYPLLEPLAATWP